MVNISQAFANVESKEAQKPCKDWIFPSVLVSSKFAKGVRVPPTGQEELKL